MERDREERSREKERERERKRVCPLSLPSRLFTFFFGKLTISNGNKKTHNNKNNKNHCNFWGKEEACAWNEYISCKDNANRESKTSHWSSRQSNSRPWESCFVLVHFIAWTWEKNKHHSNFR